MAKNPRMVRIAFDAPASQLETIVFDFIPLIKGIDNYSQTPIASVKDKNVKIAKKASGLTGSQVIMSLFTAPKVKVTTTEMKEALKEAGCSIDGVYNITHNLLKSKFIRRVGKGIYTLNAAKAK